MSNRQAQFSRQKTWFFAFAMAIGSVVLLVDVASEAWSGLSDSVVSGFYGHLLREILAACLLTAGALTAIFHLFRLELTAESSQKELRLLRQDFDRILRERFAGWKLTRSEIDVAMLTVKGLSISQIAEARHTQSGTIKAQLSSIFHKAGVASRTELLSVFIDEMLDTGSSG